MLQVQRSMGGKNKKAKPVLASDAVASQSAPEVDAVKSIYKRLRKGTDLKSLSKDAANVEKNNPSAITSLCRAKVVLCHTVDMMGDKSLYEFLTPKAATLSFEDLRGQISEIAESLRKGAEQYKSLLCGRLYFRLSQLVLHKAELSNLPTRYEELLDPNEEFVDLVQYL